MLTLTECEEFIQIMHSLQEVEEKLFQFLALRVNSEQEHESKKAVAEEEV